VTLKYCGHHLYADDLQVYYSGDADEVDVFSARVNEDLARVVSWSKENGLRLNLQKTQSLVVARPLASLSRPTLSLDGVTLDFCASLDNLGFLMEPCLSWDGFARRICGRVSAALRRLRVLSGTSVQTRIRVFKGLILPFFNYGDAFLLSASRESLRLLGKSLNDCVRFVFGLRMGEHVTSYQSRLLGCPFASYYSFRAVLLIHRLLVTGCPGYLFSRLSLSVSRRTRRLITPRNRTAAFNNSFFVQGVRIYNSLPDRVRSAATVEIFRRECLKHFNE
jgi:hypothetical protein